MNDMQDKMRECFFLIHEIISDNPDELNAMTVEDFCYYLLSESQSDYNL